MNEEIKTTSLLDYLNIFKYWIDLNGQAKAVIAILSIAIIFLTYRNYELGNDINNERTRYDALNEKYAKAQEIIRQDNAKLYQDFQVKLDDYRDRRDREVSILLNDYKERSERLQKKIEKYEEKQK